MPHPTCPACSMVLVWITVDGQSALACPRASCTRTNQEDRMSLIAGQSPDSERSKPTSGLGAPQTPPIKKPRK